MAQYLLQILMYRIGLPPVLKGNSWEYFEQLFFLILHEKIQSILCSLDHSQKQQYDCSFTICVFRDIEQLHHVNYQTLLHSKLQI